MLHHPDCLLSEWEKSSHVNSWVVVVLLQWCRPCTTTTVALSQCKLHHESCSVSITRGAVWMVWIWVACPLYGDKDVRNTASMFSLFLVWVSSQLWSALFFAFSFLGFVILVTTEDMFRDTAARRIHDVVWGSIMGKQGREHISPRPSDPGKWFCAFTAFRLMSTLCRCCPLVFLNSLDSLIPWHGIF